MHKRMRRAIAFIIACCILTGMTWSPIYADEKIVTTSGQKTEEDTHEEKEDEIENAVIGGGAETGRGTETGTEDKKRKEDEATPNDETQQEENGEGISDNSTGKQIGVENDAGKTVSGNDTEEEIEDEETGSDVDKESGEKGENEDKKSETGEIFNVVVPITYTLALNPYRLPIRTGKGEIITEQVISGTYGIVNKSSTDQIVTVSLMVEDSNGGELVFVDSAEEAEKAGMGVYAVYLAVIPANEEQIFIDGKPIEETISAESLRNVQMTGAEEQDVTLKQGVNEISFKLSKAVYDFKTEEEFPAENSENGEENLTKTEEDSESVLKELAPDGKGVTAYTFTGVMNPNASWEKLSGGIKLSVVYKYRVADGEEIVKGTGAMVGMDEVHSEKK